MSFAQFGTIIEKAPPKAEKGSFPEYGKEVEMPSRLRSIVGAPLKGATKEVADIAEFFQKIPLPKGEIEPQKLRESAERLFPTQEKELENYLERGGKVGVQALLSPGGPLVKAAQTAAGTTLGYLGEKLGAPKWAQGIFESVPFLYSGAKKIPLKPGQKNLVTFLRKEGFTENEITPLLKTPDQLERWGKWATKGKKSRELMDSIYTKTGNIYESIEQNAKSLPVIPRQAANEFIQTAQKLKQGMPNKYWKLIEEDFNDLIKTNGSFNGLTNFYKDINAVIGPEVGGRAIVGQFKEPIIKAMKSVSPPLADDFRLATDLYRTRAAASSRILSKDQVDKMLDAGEIYALGAGLFNRDIGLIGKVIGVAGARKLAREMLINPRLQNKANRIGEALKKNNLNLANKLIKDFQSSARKEDSELESNLGDGNPG